MLTKDDGKKKQTDNNTISTDRWQHYDPKLLSYLKNIACCQIRGELAIGDTKWGVKSAWDSRTYGFAKLSHSRKSIQPVRSDVNGPDRKP